MHTAWRPLHPPSPLSVVFVVTLAVLFAAGGLLISGIAGLLDVTGGVTGLWQTVAAP